MAKEKIKREELESNREIYFEVIALLLIALSLIVLSGLGNAGYFMNIFFKILLGDWYWLLFLYIIILATKTLYKRVLPNFRTYRFFGLMILLYSLMILSHPVIYEILKTKSSTGISGMWELYMYYLEDYDANYIVGGGLIGGISYSILYYLLGEIGSVLFGFLLLFISFVLLTNNNIFTFYAYLKDLFRNLKKHFKTFIGMFSRLDKGVEKKRSKKNINILMDVKESLNIAIQEKISMDLRRVIENIIKEVNKDYQFLEMFVSFQITRYTYRITTSFNLVYFKKLIIEYLEESFYIDYIKKESLLILEIPNKFKDLLTIKKLNQESLNIPIGKSVNNQLLDFDLHKDNHLLLVGNSDSGINNFIKGFIASILIKNLDQEIYLTNIGNSCNLDSSSLQTIESKDELYQLFDYLGNELDNRLELFKYLSVSNIVDCNKELKNKRLDIKLINRIFLFITDLSVFKGEIDFVESRLMYLSQVGTSLGLHLIINYGNTIPGSIIKSIIPFKMVFKTSSINLSIDILESDYGLYLLGKGDFLFRYNEVIIRGQTGYISEIEFGKIIE